MITVFTPTYNRAHTLPRLYESLQKQTCTDFEWLIIDDGSKDATSQLFDQWLQDENSFPIRYNKVENGGKDRAINTALKLARGEYFFIVDSDDLLRPTAINTLYDCFSSLPKEDESFIGVSIVKGDLDGNPLHRKPQIDPFIGYIDCNNLERPNYGLQADMAEAFFTDKFRKYEFPVWPGEKFTPEAVVWDQMALDGYRLRWFDKVEYLCEYQPDGLTNSSWRLLRDNPMGYAMLFNHQLLHTVGLKPRANLVLQFISCCCLAGEYGYLDKCNSRLLWLLGPAGWLLSIRRRKQIKNAC